MLKHKLWKKAVHRALEHVKVKWLKAYVDSYHPYAKILRQSKMYKQKLSSAWKVRSWGVKLKLSSHAALCLSLMHIHVYMKACIMLIIWPERTVCTLCKVFWCLYCVSACSVLSCQMLETLCTNVTQINFHTAEGRPLCASFQHSYCISAEFNIQY